jgi:uncharacterized membrane protein (UPF0182 family)
VLLAVLAVILVVLALSLRAIATFWTDFLWFGDIDLESVWRKLLSAKLTLGAATALVFFLLLWVNMLIADRLAPRFVAVGTDDELLVRYRELVAGRQRLLWLIIAAVIAIVPGVSASAQWREWLLFRHGGSFGIDDPQFGTDIGFYVFDLPFLSLVVDWLFGFLVVTTVVVAVVHYLNGAIRLQPMGERVTPNAKAHLSVLLALAALVKAADYWLQRYELLFAPGRSFDGAGYTAVNARLPAIQLLILISIFVAVLLLVNIFRRGWVLPVIVVALWALVAVVVGTAYPAFVQRFQVGPAELAKERPFIERNIEATRVAMGLDEVEQNDFIYDRELTAEKIAEQPANLSNARLLDPSVMIETIQDLEFGREYYRFRDVDVDRYLVDQGDGEVRTPVIISTRELNEGGVQNPTWEKLRLVFTHGYAAAVAPSNGADDRGDPNLLVSGIPAQYRGLPELERPEIYHGEDMGGYAIVGTDQTELTTDQVATRYEGESGVPVSSLFRKAAFALRFGEIEPLISGNLTPRSRVIYIRDVRERVRTVAPFLVLDADPYPVLVDGRIKYVVDAYTATTNYPYSERFDVSTVAPGQVGGFNYVRNSVKAVVDAYDGTVDLYLTDTLYGERDPIVRAYAKAFPDLFRDDIPEALSRHFRYPELLFKTQTEVWGRYHQSDPDSFFNDTDRWDIAQQPPDTGRFEQNGAATVQDLTAGLTGDSTELARIEPYYQLMQLQPGAAPRFVLTRPFVLASRDDQARNLTAVLIADNDPGDYGKLSQIVMSTRGADGEVERNNRVDGPLRANQKMFVYPPVSSYQSLVGRSGSQVRFGNLLILPFGDSLLYLRPVYARQDQNGRYTLQRVVVSAGDDVGFGDTLDAAVADLLDGDPDRALANPEDVLDDEVAGGDEAPTTTQPPTAGTTGSTPEQLLAAADQRFAEADAALRAGDLAAYQAAVRDAQRLVREAAAALTTTTTVPPTTAPATTAPSTTAPSTTAPAGEPSERDGGGGNGGGGRATSTTTEPAEGTARGASTRATGPSGGI